jgi:hypothetical protein
MSIFKASIAIASILTLSAGVSFAANLHQFSDAPGQTGSNVLSSCGPGGASNLGVGAKMNAGVDSPFNPVATKGYAGNPGNPATNPKAVSQYDNACAQAGVRSGQVP